MTGWEKRIMSSRVAACWRLAAVPLVVSACAELPPAYSPDYVTVTRVHYNQVTRRPAPLACLTPDPTVEDTAAEELGEHIPPGCANAYNLQRMVEREGDLFKGRRLGKAPAAPSVRAAQKYLNGGAEPPLGGSLAAPPRSAMSSSEPERVEQNGQERK